MFQGLLFKTVVLTIVVCAAHETKAAGPIEATWESLKHEPAEWLLDAKFGIYTHWGVYSVPAFQTEWYAKRMCDEGSSVPKHHITTYGEPWHWTNG